VFAFKINNFALQTITIMCMRVILYADGKDGAIGMKKKPYVLNKQHKNVRK